MCIPMTLTLTNTVSIHETLMKSLSDENILSDSTLVFADDVSCKADSSLAKEEPISSCISMDANLPARPSHMKPLVTPAHTTGDANSQMPLLPSAGAHGHGRASSPGACHCKRLPPGSPCDLSQQSPCRFPASLQNQRMNEFTFAIATTSRSLAKKMKLFHYPSPKRNVCRLSETDRECKAYGI